MNIPFVDLKLQYRKISEEVKSSINSVMESADFILGQELEKFEIEYANYCNTKYAVGVDNGTSALELALRAFNIGTGDEVITAANTFTATASAIVLVGAKPVFVDIEPKTYGIGPGNIEKAINSRTRAIIPVHLYGHSADMDPILLIAKKYNLIVIEDACQAHGALYKGRKVGSISHVGCFSFYPGKNLGAYGDGGMLVTNDYNIADQARMLRNYGQKQKYVHQIVGFNRRLDTMQAAILRIKLKHLDSWNSARRNHARKYSEYLPAENIILPIEEKNANHVFHLYVIRSEERNDLQSYLKSKGINTGIHYPVPIHLQQAYDYLGYSKGDFPLSEKIAEQILSLPMFPELTEDQINYVINTIRKFFGKNPI